MTKRVTVATAEEVAVAVAAAVVGEGGADERRGYGWREVHGQNFAQHANVM